MEVPEKTCDLSATIPQGPFGELHLTLRTHKLHRESTAVEEAVLLYRDLETICHSVAQSRWFQGISSVNHETEGRHWEYDQLSDQHRFALPHRTSHTGGSVRLRTHFEPHCLCCLDVKIMLSLNDGQAKISRSRLVEKASVAHCRSRPRNAGVSSHLSQCACPAVFHQRWPARIVMHLTCS